MSLKRTEQNIRKILEWVFILILVLAPFQAFLTTWLGSNFGHLDAFRIWKELLIFVMAPLALWLVYRDQKLKKWFLHSWLVGLILGYVLLTTVIGAIALLRGQVNNNSLIYALLINVRFLVFMLVGIVLASKMKTDKSWRKWVLWPAAIVIVFGLLQITVLPANFLTHFGYGPNTIPAVQTVDQKIAYRRIQSTLRGANPLGAYLVLILPLLFIGSKEKYKRAAWLAAGLITLIFTYSRSAWIGTAISLGLVIYWSFKSQKLRRWLLSAGAVVILVGAGGTLLFRNNRVVENTLFHTDKTSRSSQSSNAQRTSNLEHGLTDIAKEPLGRGPGTAGPASFRNDHPARIAEDYYLQIGQEVGILGVVLFLSINFVVARLLWLNRQDKLALVLFTSLIGITFINLLSHAWADDTLSLVWWGLAGLVIGVILNKERKINV